MASMQGLVDDKVQAVEDLDRKVIAKVLKALEGRKDVKILLTVNHMCSANLMKYGNEPVPFIIFPADKQVDCVHRFDEQIIKKSSMHYKSGRDLMETFFKGTMPVQEYS